MFGIKTLPQLALTLFVALALSFLTFAASQAEVPRSEYAPVVSAN